MITLVIGGSGSGKSAYAETLLEGVPVKYYLATMLEEDDEAKKKVQRHQRLRQGKGFVTVEQPRSLGRAAEKMKKERKEFSGALLECVSNLTANEMFCPEGVQAPKAVVKTVVSGIQAVAAAVDQLVIVSNNVFEDGMDYDAGTMAYLHSMGMINEELAQLADKVVEVVVGIPVVWKE